MFGGTVAGPLKELEPGKMVYNEWGSELGLDGARFSGREDLCQGSLD